MDTKLQERSWLVQQLISQALVTESQLELALREQKRTGGQLGQILVYLGFVEPEVLSSLLAEGATANMVNLNRVMVDQAAVQMVPVELARRFKVMPVSRNGKTMTVAMADPFDVVAIDTLQQVTGLGIDVVTAPERDILNSHDLYYSVGATIEESIDAALEERAKEEVLPIEEMLARLEDTADDAPVIRLVSRIINRAIQRGASDIHFEPEERLMRIRTRVDGVLFPDVLIPKAMQSAVCTRMKILADLDVAENRIPQDGRATIMVGARQVNLRVSSLPTAHGENIVARILDPSSQVLSLPSLGFAPDTEHQFREMVNKPYGVVLVTGPTGSGKTTTLYAVLHEVASMEVSTFTLEDPIEYRMPLVRQTQIKEEVGMTFSNGLRALLRQDPDVILVGETRDTETAQLMVRAALTGHLVFSTLHTNDAAGAIPRLVDMGVEPYLLPASLLGILAQRLVRSICPKCKSERLDAAKVFEEAGVKPPPMMAPRLWRGEGCPECRNTGYKGRQGVYELLSIDERFHEPIVRRAGAPEYVRLGRERGMRTMFEDGVLKAVQGGTTMEELMRVIRLDGH